MQFCLVVLSQDDEEEEEDELKTGYKHGLFKQKVDRCNSVQQNTSINEHRPTATD